MTDDLVIASGGAVAVDTGSLRFAADLVLGCDGLLALAADALAAAATTLSAIVPHTPLALDDVRVLSGVIAERSAAAQNMAATLVTAAAGYELVELRAAHQAALAAGDHALAARLDDAIAGVLADNPDAGAVADAAWRIPDAGSELMRQVLAGSAAGGWLLPALGLGAAVGLVRMLGRGTVPAASAAAAGGRPARLVPVAVTAPPPHGPASLADVAARVPSGGAARIRVERYASASGPVFAVYVTGTRALAGEDPWDMDSNVRGYLGTGSDASATLHAALAAAGAERGDTVYAFGHSQGGMLAGQLAAGGYYDTEMLVTFGSPTAVDPGDGALSVHVRHSDDPVVLLAGGGHDGPVGDGSGMIISRVADPDLHPSDLALGAHHMEVYRETAAMADVSGDPRMSAVEERLAPLAGQVPDLVVEYGAERMPAAPPPPVPPPPGPYPLPVPVPPVTGSGALSPSWRDGG